MHAVFGEEMLVCSLQCGYVVVFGKEVLVRNLSLGMCGFRSESVTNRIKHGKYVP